MSKRVQKLVNETRKLLRGPGLQEGVLSRQQETELYEAGVVIKDLATALKEAKTALTSLKPKAEARVKMMHSMLQKGDDDDDDHISDILHNMKLPMEKFASLLTILDEMEAAAADASKEAAEYSLLRSKRAQQRR